MELVLDLGEKRSIDHAVLREDIRRGERIRRYVIEVDAGEGWRQVASGEAVGARKIHWFAPLEAEKLRLRVVEAAAPPVVRELSAHDVTGPRAGEIYAEAKRKMAGGRPAGDVLADLGFAIERVPAFGPFHLLRGVAGDAEGKLETALADLDLVLALDESPSEVRHLRAGVLFKLERFTEALRDYDLAVAAGRPHDDDSCWERGLAWYYAGDFDAGRRQFEGYHRVGPDDIENGLWRFLCIGELRGEPEAVKTLLEYPQRRRKPFPALLDLYSGKGSREAVLAEAVEGVESEAGRNENLFYAHYYIGKLLELRRDRDGARMCFDAALERRVPHFMYDCCRIDRKRLEEAK
jgi:lipoprotein NlpI